MNEDTKVEETATLIRNDIRTGKYAPGEKLPSERELAQDMQVSRETLRRAIQKLEAEDLITRRSTSGTYVKVEAPIIEVVRGQEIIQGSEEAPTAGDELAHSGSFIENMRRRGRKPTITFIDPIALVAASMEVAQHLQVPLRSIVLRRYRLQSADSIPYRIIESYYPGDLFGELLQTDIGEKPLFQWLLEHHGKQVQHVAEELTARLPTPIERQWLKMSSSSPVMAFERTVWEQEQRVVEWAKVTAVAALYRFHYEYDIAWES
jgi:DNA-binding GntR family transcriptional regulator